MSVTTRLATLKKGQRFTFTGLEELGVYEVISEGVNPCVRACSVCVVDFHSFDPVTGEDRQVRITHRAEARALSGGALVEPV